MVSWVYFYLFFPEEVYPTFLKINIDPVKKKRANQCEIQNWFPKSKIDINCKGYSKIRGNIVEKADIGKYIFLLAVDWRILEVNCLPNTY